MQWSGIEEKYLKCINFPNYAKSNTDDCTGGIINNGTWGWIVNGSHLQILSLDNGENISNYDFADFVSPDVIIVCIEEIKCYEDIILAIILQNSISNSGGSLDNSILALYSINTSCILTSISLNGQVTCTRFIEHGCVEKIFKFFDGCLAIADAQGAIILLNLNLKNLLNEHKDKKLCEKVRRHFCHILDYNDLQENLKCNYDEFYYAIELPVAVKEEPTTICSLLAIPPIEGLAVGLEDGRLAIYDLVKLRLNSIFIPEPQYTNMPIVEICFLLPLDDPRPSLYVWAVHQNDKKIAAVMHGLFYDKYHGASLLKDFRKSNVCLEMALESMPHSVFTSCQAISLAPVHGDEDTGTFCMFSWYARNADKNKILLFDLNQWYKEQMPTFLNEKYSNFTMRLTLHDGAQENCLQVYINPKTISQYNSVQRAEEHFYPNALSFSLIVLQRTNCRIFNWEGIQNRLIQIFQKSNAAIFLEVDNYFNKILQANLLPQIMNATPFNTNTEVSLEKKYDVLLSVALENNCYNLLRDCVHSWSDGSFSGNLGPTTGLSLSVITEWIWHSATNLEKRCLYLCNGLLENNGYDIDRREQKELGSLTRQLKLLYDLMGEIIISSKRKIPQEVNNTLQKQSKSLHANTFFYRVVLWLFNIGLLPATNHNNASTSPANSDTAFVYNYMELELLYRKRREYFANLCKDSISKRTKTCRLLYIDAFIEQECRNSDLYELWCQSNNGNGSYPPRSLSDMLRILLLPNIKFDSKCIILMYFFLDLHVMLTQLKPNKSIEEQFVKFPSVFQLPVSLMKTVQTFWFIDRGCFSPIIDEYISLIKKNQIQSEWLLELLMEILLVQHKADLALRVLQARPVIISPKMKLKTLIANNLITEAFHMARSDNTAVLLELFFNYCIDTGRYGVVRDLTLNEREGHLLQRLLNSSKVFCAENLQFVYLLSRSKYIEAIAYMDELSKHKELRNSQSNNNNNCYNNTIESSQLVLSAFNTTIAPMQQGLTDTYFRIHNKIKRKDVQNKNDPVPLSCQLIKENANNLLGGIYHSSALSAHFATYNYEESQRKTKKLIEEAKKTNLFIPNNMPFLRKPQVENYAQDFNDKNSISIPQLYCVPNKRHLHEDHEVNKLEDAKEEYNPPKRLRLLEHKVIDVDFLQNYREPINTPNHQHHHMDTDVMPAKEPVRTQGILKRQKNLQIDESSILQKRNKIDNNDEDSIKSNNSKETTASEIENNDESITSNNTHQMIDLQTPEKPYKPVLPSALNDIGYSIQNNSSVQAKIPTSVAESPKPRKPLNHEANLKDFECMQQHTIVPTIVVCDASPQSKLRSIEKEVIAGSEEELIKIEEFKPIVSSSKVCETQSRFAESEQKNIMKYTECSTVIGTLSYNDDISTDNVSKCSTSTTTTTTTFRNNETSRKAMLETTMDMTSWEEGFLLERDAAIHLQEENHAKGHLTKENKETYFTALSSNWHNKDSGLSSTLTSKKSQIAENNQNYNLYDFDEQILGTQEEASIILSLEDSDLACMEVNRSLKTSSVVAKETHDNNLEENVKENSENLSAELETRETSFYQSFCEEKNTNDKNSENENYQEDNVEENKNLVEKHDNSIVISIDDSDSFTSNHIESDGENQQANKDKEILLQEEESEVETEEDAPRIDEEREAESEPETVEIAHKLEEESEAARKEVAHSIGNELNIPAMKSDVAAYKSEDSPPIKMPVLLTDDVEHELSRRRTIKRGISVPPQTTQVSEDSPAAYVMEKAIRHRASSLQPLSELDECNKYTEPVESPKVSKGRGRRRTSLHEMVTLSPILGSPYQNTRSRVRQNSEESENDISIVSQTTRSRRKSTASEINDDNDVVAVNRPLRKRKLSTSDNVKPSSVETEEKSQKQNSELTEVFDSKTVLKQRRLTRVQLKAFEKSLNQNSDNLDTEKVPDSPISSRTLRRTRSTHSMEKEIDDDASSEKSVASSTRSKRSTKAKTVAQKPPLSVIIEDEPVSTTPKSRTRKSKK